LPGLHRDKRQPWRRSFMPRRRRASIPSARAGSKNRRGGNLPTSYIITLVSRKRVPRGRDHWAHQPGRGRTSCATAGRAGPCSA
jgi:hypothetical protein